MRRSGRNPLLLLVLLAGCAGGTDAGTPATAVLEAPESLDLGTVALGGTAEGMLALRNGGTADLVVEGVEVPAPFTGGGDFPATLVPGAVRAVRVSFTPAAPGPVAEVLRVRAGGAVHEVRLAAVGGPSPLRCAPDAVDLGRPVLGTVRTFRISCVNEADHFLVFRADLGGSPELASTLEGPFTLPEGDGVLGLDFEYRPVGLAPLAATVRFVSGEATLAEVQVTATPIATAVSVHGPDDPSCPGGLDLGFTPPGTTRAGPAFFLANAGDQPIELSGLTVEGPFTVSPAAPATLPADDPATAADEGVLEFATTFAPAAPGPAAGRVTVTFADPAQAPVHVCLSGFGGGPVIACTPEALDFGPTAAGLPRTETVTCTNVGTDVPGTDDVRLRLDSTEATGPGFSAEAALPARGLGPGESVAIAVSFDPVAAGAAAGSLMIASNDPVTPRLELALAGDGLLVSPCVARIDPPALDFGPVAAGGTPATLPVVLHNDGTEACLIRDLALAPATAGAFSLPGGPIDAAVIEPGGALSVPVRFAPGGGAGTGALAFGISAPASPIRTVPLAGTTAPATPCLQAFPESVDFGEVAPGCASLVAEVALFNTCGEAIAVDGVTVAGEAAPFHLVGGALPGSLAPGLASTVTVEYRPAASGEHFAGIRWSSAEGAGRLVPLRGLATAPSGVETFAPGPRAVDVLFVMDNSGGISEEQAAARAALPALLAVADERDVDWRFGVTTTGVVAGNGACPGGAGGGEDGRLFPVNGSAPRVVRPTMANAAALAAANLAVGDCHYDEQGLEGAYRALTPPVSDHDDDPRHPEPDDGNLGFLRPDARLAVIALMDEVDQSPGTVAFYAATLGGVKRQAWREPRAAAHAITGERGTGCSRPGTGAADAGDKLIAWSEATGGHFMSICSTDWERDFTELGLVAFGRTRFPLRGRPAGTVAPTTADLRVLVDGRPWVGPATGWRWDAAANEVVFAPEEAPEPDATVEFRYTPACVPPAP